MKWEMVVQRMERWSWWEVNEWVVSSFEFERKKNFPESRAALKSGQDGNIESDQSGRRVTLLERHRSSSNQHMKPDYDPEFTDVRFKIKDKHIVIFAAQK